MKKRNPSTSVLIRIAVLSILYLMGTITITATEPGEKTSTAETPKKETDCTEEREAKAAYLPITHGGMRVFIDAKTGKLRQPTEGEIKEMSLALREMYGHRLKSENTESMTLPNGGQAMVLDPMYHSLSMVRYNSDGTITQECVKGLEQAKAFIEAKPPAPLKQKEREDM